MIRRRFLFGALMLALFSLGWWVGRAATGDLYTNLDVFVEVLHRVQDNYVDPVKPARAVTGAIEGMLKDLDPYSQYLTADDYAGLQSVAQGKFSGIGVVVGLHGDFPTVISPIEGSPAWEAGLHSGDVIVKIDATSTAELTVEGVAKLLRGGEGTKVTVVVAREGEPGEQSYALTRREIVTQSVPYAFMAGNDLGYVRLANFSEKSGAEVRDALTRLRAEGARCFVLDLRMNPGGLLDQAVDVAEQFLPKGAMVVSTRGRARNQDQRYYAGHAAGDVRSPLVVLIDEGSASASEIVAGALQDLDRALVIGRTSFGKGSVQSIYPLSGMDTAIKLTTALYYTPSGRSIHRPRLAGFDPNAEPDDPTPADSSQDTTVTRPVFHTAAGRIVHGGGGITPDVAGPADSLAGLAREIERRGLTFRFANKWVNEHPGVTASATLPETIWSAFGAYLRGENLKAEDGALAAERAVIERSVRRELARRTGGDAAAMRIALEGDAVFGRAAAILEHSLRPGDVFATAVGDRSHLPAR